MPTQKRPISNLLLLQHQLSLELGQLTVEGLEGVVDLLQVLQQPRLWDKLTIVLGHLAGSRAWFGFRKQQGHDVKQQCCKASGPLCTSTMSIVSIVD